MRSRVRARQGRLFVGEISSGAFDLLTEAGIVRISADCGISLRGSRRPMGLSQSPAFASRCQDRRISSALQSQGIVSAGSSLKFCLVAAGEADIYPRLGRTWSGTPPPAMPFSPRGRQRHQARRQAIRLRQNRRKIRNPFFVARGRS